MKETWKPIKNYEGLYEVSNKGQVRSLNYKRTGEIKILKLRVDKYGYLQVHLSKNGKHYAKSIHRLVAQTFIPNPNNYSQVNHKDEKRDNNNVENLEWCNCKYNNNYGNRNKKISELLALLAIYFKKEYSGFYIDFGKIVNEIRVEELSESDFNSFQFIIDSLIKNKEHINFDFSDCIIKIKQRKPNIKKYDKLFNNKDSTENILYNVEIRDNELEAIKSIVNIYRQRHEEREKNPGVFVGYWNDYNIGTSIFSSERYKDENKNFILNKYLPLAKEIITSKNEILYEKIRHIRLLAHLLMVEKDEKIVNDIYLMIHSSIEILIHINRLILKIFTIKIKMI